VEHCPVIGTLLYIYATASHSVVCDMGLTTSFHATETVGGTPQMTASRGQAPEDLPQYPGDEQLTAGDLQG